MLTVIATLRVTPGKEKDFEKEARGMVELVGKEEGTLAYVLHRALKDPCCFVFYEKYRSRQDLDAHSSTPYFKRFFQTITPLLAGKPEVALYEELKQAEKK